MKLTKSLKITILITLLLAISAPVIIWLVGFTLGNPYRDTVEYTIDFSQDIELEKTQEAFKKVKQFETLEKKNDQEYIATYFNLNDQQRKDIQTNLEELDKEVSVVTLEKSKVNRNLDFLYFMIPVILVLSGFGAYLLVPESKKSRNRWGVSIAAILYLSIVSVVTIAIFSILSQIEPIGYFGIVLTGGLLLANYLFTAVMLLRLNTYLDKSPQKNFVNTVINFAEEYDESYVVFQLMSLLVLFPLVLISNRQIEFGIALILIIILNIYMQTYGFVHLIALWQFAIDHLPVIKKLKWTRK